MTDDELCQYAKRHVSYEVTSLWRSAVEFAKTESWQSERDWTVANSLLEACLVHARLLSDFVKVPDTKDGKKVRRKDGDVYSGTYDVTPADAPLHSKLREGTTIREGINKRVAHLDVSRKDPEYWDLLKIVDDVMNGVEGFVHGLPEKWRECFSWFEEEKRQWEAQRQLLKPGFVATSNTQVYVLKTGTGDGSGS